VKKREIDTDVETEIGNETKEVRKEIGETNQDRINKNSDAAKMM
jgi:hypothetical protein